MKINSALLKGNTLRLIVFSFVLTFSFTSFWSQRIISLYGDAQGTSYAIKYTDTLGRNFQNEIDSILYFFDLSVSTYQLESIITKINKNQIFQTNDATFLHCFFQAKNVWASTKGAFDPTVYPLVNAWGFGPERKSEKELHQNSIDSILHFVGFEKIQIDSSGNITKTDPRVSLDFNAFAQGYSVDLISLFLRTQNIENFIVEIGGEVYASAQSMDPWVVGVEYPAFNMNKKNDMYLALSLQNKGIATSGNYRKYREIHGEKRAHHIDPKTGNPTTNNLLSISLISDKTINSDAYATGLLVLGYRKSKRFLEKHPEMDAMMIYSKKNGDVGVFKTSGFLSKEIGF